MKVDKRHLKEMVRQVVRKQLDESPVNEISPAFAAAAQYGITKGRKSPAVSRSSVDRKRRRQRGEEIKTVRKKQDKRVNMNKRFDSAQKYWSKVFGKQYSQGHRDGRFNIGKPYSATVALKEEESMAGQVFVVQVLENGKVVDTKKFNIGLGTKESIARLVKKLAKKNQQVSEGKTSTKIENWLNQVVKEEIEYILGKENQKL